ncbi:MAG: crossover junction endodeoxyribonuclease RuvC [Bacteroidales bacterium]|nr:crossover junction endodeoxyribonuclease RuvC [Bacteroidales bacterium]MDD3701999.1 crossover junction endodeoxyribonuclease RuvC [Bacteroidales bacterium]MDY0368989.1 crossover junction endodeoxyribonuclease RuvC [Bacteroidales bacterium]
MKKERIILGIDPGTTVMGYGLIIQQGNDIQLIAMGVLKLNKFSSHALRLQKIFERTHDLIREYHPDELAIEAPFYGKNVQSMLKLGRAQGVAMAAALHNGLPIFEYSPKKIKQSITGNGNASKEQVAAMLKTLLKFVNQPEQLDATDGLAAAVCHFFQSKLPTTTTGYSGWKAFIAQNPERIGKK